MPVVPFTLRDDRAIGHPSAESMGGESHKH